MLRSPFWKTAAMFAFFQSPWTWPESRNCWKIIRKIRVISSAKSLNSLVGTMSGPMALFILNPLSSFGDSIDWDPDIGHAWIQAFAEIWLACKVLVNEDFYTLQWSVSLLPSLKGGIVEDCTVYNNFPALFQGICLFKVWILYWTFILKNLPDDSLIHELELLCARSWDSSWWCRFSDKLFCKFCWYFFQA